ncbi:hypothetical protein OIU91_03210 [Streptomyces sp. NBC_01456]|uniref:hypothetical protein n=1 Tax=unclassified Streptomyces TaxID=2593676 RepID=UPI002E3403C4|nr:MULTISPECIES: hypothetical protein [unclassified Streptomyces]
MSRSTAYADTASTWSGSFGVPRASAIRFHAWYGLISSHGTEARTASASIASTAARDRC